MASATTSAMGWTASSVLASKAFGRWEFGATV